jgi:hypothetical protein
MIKHRIICNAKTGVVTREQVEDNTPVWVDYAAMIEDCKQRLAETDYVVIKIAEGAVSRGEYASVIAERVALRERIGMLEQLQSEQMG